MPITKRQKAKRNRVGASEVGALFPDIDRFKSATDVYYRLVYGVETRSNAAMEAGTWLEAGIIDYAENRYWKLRRNVERLAPDGIPLRVHCDSVTVKTNEPVEIKTEGLLSGRLYQVWGPDGTDEVPAVVNIQVHAQMLCLGAYVGHVVAFLVGRGFAWFRIERNERLMRAIIKRVNSFWFHHVLPKIPPPVLPSYQTLRDVKRVRGKVPLGDEAASLVARWESAKHLLASKSAKKKEADTIVRDLEKRLLVLIANTETGELPDGRLVTFRETFRNAYTVNSSSYRTFRIINQ